MTIHYMLITFSIVFWFCHFLKRDKWIDEFVISWLKYIEIFLKEIDKNEHFDKFVKTKRIHNTINPKKLHFKFWSDRLEDCIEDYETFLIVTDYVNNLSKTKKQLNRK